MSTIICGKPCTPSVSACGGGVPAGFPPGAIGVCHLDSSETSSAHALLSLLTGPLLLGGGAAAPRSLHVELVACRQCPATSARLLATHPRQAECVFVEHVPVVRHRVAAVRSRRSRSCGRCRHFPVNRATFGCTLRRGLPASRVHRRGIDAFFGKSFGVGGVSDVETCSYLASVGAARALRRCDACVPPLTAPRRSETRIVLRRPLSDHHRAPLLESNAHPGFPSSSMWCRIGGFPSPRGPQQNVRSNWGDTGAASISERPCSVTPWSSIAPIPCGSSVLPGHANAGAPLGGLRIRPSNVVLAPNWCRSDRPPFSLACPQRGGCDQAGRGGGPAHGEVTYADFSADSLCPIGD